MFAKILALFAVVAVSLAAPEPKPAPAPAPQVLYTGLDYAYPALTAPVVSPYAAPVYSAYSAYSAYPTAGAYFVRK